MAATNDVTTLVCLFHHPDQAHEVILDLLQAGIPRSSVSLIDSLGSGADGRGDSAVAKAPDANAPDANAPVTNASGANASLHQLEIPAKDRQHLLDVLSKGGALVAVSTLAEQMSRVEAIFEDHQATRIDEPAKGEDVDRPVAPLAGQFAGFTGPVVAGPVVTGPVAAGPIVAGTAATGAGLAASGSGDAALPVAGWRDAGTPPSESGARADAAIPVVEEELTVGKRTVEQGVRLYRRVIEIPAEDSVNLREERVVVERRPVDRAATEEDVALSGDRTIELTETAEEAVISKNARVVEEVRVGKDSRERTERIHDTVRKTEVEVEELNTNADRDRRRA